MALSGEDWKKASIDLVLNTDYCPQKTDTESVFSRVVQGYSSSLKIGGPRTFVLNKIGFYKNKKKAQSLLTKSFKIHLITS